MDEFELIKLYLEADARGYQDSKPRKKMYRNCDRCRAAKRACDAQYDSVAEALSAGVACSNCRKKGLVCTFNHIISTFGTGNLGVPDGTHSSRKRRLSGGQVVWADSNQSTRDTVLYRPGLGYGATGSRITANVDRMFLDRDLMGIYQGAAEQALRCWITNANTPYLFEEQELRHPSENGTLHWKVCQLDGAALKFLRPTSARPQTTENEIREAFHAVLLAFAAQWPRHRKAMDRHVRADADMWQPDEARIRLELWKQARDKLIAVSEAWSFRIIFALILFAWTEKPPEVPVQAHWQVSSGCPSALDDNLALDVSSWQDPAEASTMMLASAGRKLLNFRNRIKSLRRKGINPFGSDSVPLGSPPSDADRARAVQASLFEKTYHNLFWLGVMIDTETAVLRKHAPAICDDDTDLVSQSVLTGFSFDEPPASSQPYPQTQSQDTSGGAFPFLPQWQQQLPKQDLAYPETFSYPQSTSSTASSGPTPPLAQQHHQQYHQQHQYHQPISGGLVQPRRPGQIRKIWDDMILPTSKAQESTFARVWPSSEAAALRTLAFSAPVKVLLFRHIGRIQSAYWRESGPDAIERHIADGLEVIAHWEEVYDPFLTSCIIHHASLPASIQSWYLLITAPWNLAVLLLVELVERVDESGLSDPGQASLRAQMDTLGQLRIRACGQVRQLISAVQACPTALFGRTVLHTEPWAEILVHSLCAAAKHDPGAVDQCLWALGQLSDRSHLASLAYEDIVARQKMSPPLAPDASTAPVAEVQDIEQPEALYTSFDDIANFDIFPVHSTQA